MEMQMYLIQVSGRTVYACTDPRRFERQAQKVANVKNAELKLEVLGPKK
jgi:hypothetical protein